MRSDLNIVEKSMIKRGRFSGLSIYKTIRLPKTNNYSGFFTAFLFCYFLSIGVVFSQGTYANDWINYDQQYFKISTAANGIYKITQAELIAAGVPSSTDPRNIQLFHRGIQQSIVVDGETNGTFDPTDYILFYGKKNDGTQDKQMYVAPDAQPHNYYNLYSDTTAYFLTIANGAGKRMSIVNESASGLPAANYHMDEKLSVFTTSYWKGREYSVDTYLSQYDWAEGWTGTHFRDGQSSDVVFTNITRTFVTAADPVIDIILTGRNANLHNVEILVGPAANSLRSLTTTQFSAHENKKITTPINWSDISAGGQLVVRVAVQSGTVTDYVSISAVKLLYAQLPDMESKASKWLTFNNLSAKSSLKISNSLPGSAIFNITDKDNVSRLGFTVNGTDLTTVVPQGNRKLFVTSQFLSIPSIKKTQFQNINPTAFNYLIISHKALMGGSSNPVQEYASYRTSVEGGGFSPLVVEISQLYDQFNYGESSPLAIREFARFMLGSGDPQYLLLIGNGLSVAYRYYRNGPSGTYHDFVPTMGEPGSDIALTTSLDSSLPNVPAIPTGRITAATPEDVTSYLDKVKQMESTPYNELWRKNIVHLSGGANENELLTFRQYVNDFKGVAEDHFLGGKVITKGKKSNNAVELINIAEEVNKGVALITFFGHSGTLSTDIEIGYASDDGQNYRNEGKYPFILVNGCDAGNIFANIYSFGQDWISTPDRGAVGFVAHSAKGLSSNLKKYTDQFYATAFGDPNYINKSIGEVFQEVITRYLEDYAASAASIAQVQQMVYQGDPALKMFGAEHPDFEINESNISLTSFDDKKVTALSDSFNVSMVVRNFGRTLSDSLNVQVRRKLENDTYLYYDSVYFPVFYMDTLSITVKNYSENDNFGNNEFEVSLDYLNSIDELDEINNVATLTYYIPLGGTTNLLPYDFAIVSEGTPELITQSNNVLDESRTYLFQLDTTSLFNSQALSQHSVQSQALASWKPQLLESLAGDSIVYFWRTKFANPKPGEDSTWAESSFVYIKDGPEGWAQTHFLQYKNNETKGLTLNNTNRTVNFLENTVPMEVTTYGIDHPEKNNLDIVVNLNNYPFIVASPSYKVCRTNAIGAIAFDRSSLEPYLIIDRVSYNDPIGCGRSPMVINNFNENEILNTKRFNAYINAVPEGDIVLLFSIGSNNFETWTQDVRDAFNSVGASADVFAALKNGEPYILLGKKGGAALTEIKGEKDDEISISENLIGKFNNGDFGSPKIGPAKSWGKMISKVDYSPNSENDLYTYDVIGIDLNNKEFILYENVLAGEFSLESINAAQYPLIKLKLHISDEIDLTPVQPKKWMVLYEPMPEGILLLDQEFKNTLPVVKKYEGELLNVGYTFHNLSNKDFEDSLTISYSVLNKLSRVTEEKKMKIPALAAKDTAQFILPFSTENKTGENNIKVFVNPRIIPEQNYNNNIIDLQDYLLVEGDDRNPTIDVAFDGQYIMDGDIVSPEPLITVITKDGSPFLKKTDTVGMEIMLKRPCENCSYEKINFSSPQISWTPASEGSDFKVEFKPETLEDGIHSLKVQSMDGSGNLSANKPYSINFEVVNESTITNFYPYPNPFSTSTRFVFTLTGKDIPDQIKIQIMTVTGKVVREITQNELGPISIGNNISEFAWNGKDEFGDQLANGVYLYRVIVVNRGEGLKRRETSADKAFKNGFGKMYLLR